MRPVVFVLHRVGTYCLSGLLAVLFIAGCSTSDDAHIALYETIKKLKSGHFVGAYGVKDGDLFTRSDIERIQRGPISYSACAVIYICIYYCLLYNNILTKRHAWPLSRIRLEDEIQQHVFDDEFLKATLNILVTADRLSAATSRLLKPYEISGEQYNVLRILRGQHPKVSPLRLISERMISKSSNATRLVEKLRQKGFVSRTICESNRRQVEILITKSGLRLLDELDPVIRAQSNQMNKITKTEAKELNRILDKIRSQETFFCLF